MGAPPGPLGRCHATARRFLPHQNPRHTARQPGSMQEGSGAPARCRPRPRPRHCLVDGFFIRIGEHGHKPGAYGGNPCRFLARIPARTPTVAWTTTSMRCRGLRKALRRTLDRHAGPMRAAGACQRRMSGSGSMPAQPSSKRTARLSRLIEPESCRSAFRPRKRYLALRGRRGPCRCRAACLSGLIEPESGCAASRPRKECFDMHVRGEPGRYRVARLSGLIGRGSDCTFPGYAKGSLECMAGRGAWQVPRCAPYGFDRIVVRPHLSRPRKGSLECMARREGRAGVALANRALGCPAGGGHSAAVW